VRTEEICPDDIDDSVSGTAHPFQARVNKVADVRVTVIGADPDALHLHINSGLARP